MTLGERMRATEVGVHQGPVTATRPTGEPLAVVQRRRIADRPARRATTRRNRSRGHPEEYRVGPDASPCPRGGSSANPTPRRKDCRSSRPESWPDPYYQQHGDVPDSVQQASGLRGFFRLTRGLVDSSPVPGREPGEGQVCFCVRTTESRSPQTRGCWNGTAASATTAGSGGGWSSGRGHARCRTSTPRSSAPVGRVPGHLQHVRSDLGLEVAEFRVTRRRSRAAELAGRSRVGVVVFLMFRSRDSGVPFSFLSPLPEVSPMRHRRGRVSR